MYAYINNNTNDSTIVNLTEESMLFTNQLIKPIVQVAAITYEKLKEIYSEKDNSSI